MNSAPDAIKHEPSNTRDKLMAQYVNLPTMASACVVTNFSAPQWGALSLSEVANELSSKAGAVRRGELGEGECMLAAQALALNSIFSELARCAALNMGEHIQAADIYMKLALRAQSQCRATWETIAAIKNPPVVFAKQANVAMGHQQVNNGIAEPVARTKENTISPSELLEQSHGQRLDTGKTREAGRGDPAMAAVDSFQRPPHRRRKVNV